MVLCNVECIERVARYLDVSPEELEILDKDILFATDYQKSLSLLSFSTIIQALARASKCANILSDEREVQALSQQWLEYVTVCVNYADIPANAKRIFHELNSALRDVTFITGTRKTIADVTLYYILHPIMKGLNQQEKAKYIHVSRWFDNVQQEERLRQEWALDDSCSYTMQPMAKISGLNSLTTLLDFPLQSSIRLMVLYTNHE